MTVDTVALELGGEVSLADYSDGVGRFRSLLRELGRDVAAGASITWRVDALEAGSATMVCRGMASNGTQPAEIERVVRAYGQIGKSLERGERPAHSVAVSQQADALLSLLSERIPTIRFETPEVDAIIGLRPSSPDEAGTQPVTRAAFGAIEGRIQTLSSRRGVRFTLYDTLHDKAVSCYLADDFNTERLRHVWGRRAIVEGVVRREPNSGRALTIRQVTDVVTLPEDGPHDYRQAKGAITVPDNSPLPEQVIRRFRDGE